MSVKVGESEKKDKWWKKKWKRKTGGGGAGRIKIAAWVVGDRR